jgi:hypothetical protein
MKSLHRLLAILMMLMGINDNAFASDTSGTDEATCLRASDMYLVQGNPEMAASKKNSLVFVSHGKAVVKVNSELIGIEGNAVNTACLPHTVTQVANRFEFQFQPMIAMK